MTITINWTTRVIDVPKVDTSLVQSSPTEIRQLDLNAFRLELKSLEASSQGIPFLDTHGHTAPVTVGGVELARTVEIINGYTVTFEDGQYGVNLVGANSNVADVTNVNQVSIRSQNSAGLTFSSAINSQSFLDAAVYLDAEIGLSGTAFPRGTPSDPVNNLADALAIATRERLRKFKIRGIITLPQAYEGYTFEGLVSQSTACLHLNSQSVDGSAFQNLEITGNGSGVATITDCKIDTLSGVSGRFIECVNNGVILPGGNTVTSLKRCNSELKEGEDIVSIDLAATEADCNIVDYQGTVLIKNCNTSTETVLIALTAGSVVLDETNTAGTIVIQGVGSVEDSSAGATVITTSLIDPKNVRESIAAVYAEVSADEEITGNTLIKRAAGTQTVLRTKTITGGEFVDVEVSE